MIIHTGYKFTFPTAYHICMLILILVIQPGTQLHAHTHTASIQQLNPNEPEDIELSTSCSPQSTQCSNREQHNNVNSKGTPSHHHHHHAHSHHQDYSNDKHFDVEPSDEFVHEDLGLQIGISYHKLVEEEPDPEVQHNMELVNEGSENTEFDFRENDIEFTRSHYALDNRKAVRLALAEQKINMKLTVISLFDTRGAIPKDDKCYQSLKKYLEEYEDDTKALRGLSGYSRAHNVTANPLLLYRMIRRIVVTLQTKVMKACKKNRNTFEIIEVVESTIAASGISLPSHQDLEDALLGVLRIHYVYGYNATSQLRFGKFGNIDTGVTLNFYDCLALGNMALEIGANVLAFQWFWAADLSLSEVVQEESISCVDELNAAWKKLHQQTKLKGKRVFDVLKNARQETLSPLFYPYTEYADCRGESTQTPSQMAQLRCFEERSANPYWTINPLKAELLSLDPPVWQFYNFIGDRTVDYLKKKAYPVLARSGVVDASKRRTEFSSYRTSMQAWLYDDEEDPDPQIFKLNKRMEMLTGLEINKPGASHALQMVAYSSLGGHYDFHDDALENPDLTKKDGDRIATFLMFLSDVQLGGYTAFPRLGIGARPQKGSALLWYSLYLNGKPDKRPRHGGCPVVLGSKLAGNKWILYNENFLKYSCSLNPEA